MSKLRVLSLINTSAGIWLLGAPFVLSLPHVYPHQLAFLSSLAVGAVVMPLSVLHGLQWESARRASRINLSLGLLLAASPLFFGYHYPNGAGRAATINAVVTGAVIVAGAALCLAGSGTGEPKPVTPQVQSAPALWAVPASGGQPRPFVTRADAQRSNESEQETARAKLPFAWAAVGLIIAGAALLGLATVGQSWPLAAAGLLVAVLGAALGVRVRVLSDVSLGQRPEGS